ncbi:MAG TPA: serine/threonine-protein kinase [Dactylosporangium sp.]|nr:serine/threonine-protein kinase [Dactylosporangium sp.]
MNGEWHTGAIVAGTYEVLGELGRGGMGVVHRVRHLDWGVDLAVKAPLPGTATSRDLFVAEAETWVSLGLHPNVCACHYVRNLGGEPRLFAEYVPGGTVKDQIKSRMLYRGSSDRALARVLDLAVQAAWGLAHAHGRGLVHADVKPANVLIDDDGNAKVTDFGLTRAAGLAVGGLTPAYASPEQAAGRPVGPPGDVFSLAVSVLEMLVGDVTWPAGSIAGAALREEMTDPGGTLPIPPALGELLLRCLDDDPRSRPPDGAAFAGALVELWPAVVGTAYPRTAPREADLRADGLNNRALSEADLGRLTEASRSFAGALDADPRHPAAAYNAGLLHWRAGNTTDVELVEALTAISGESSVSSEARELLGHVHLERGDVTAARECGVEPPNGLPDAALLFEERLPWRPPPRNNRELPDVAVAYDREGRRAVSGYHDRVLRVWRDGTVERELTGHTAEIRAALIHPDGRLAISGGRDAVIRLWDLDTGSPVGELHGHARDVMTLALSPSGDRLLSAGYDGTLRLWSLPGGAPGPVIEQPDAIQCVALSEDGLALSGAGDGFRVWRVDTGELLHHWPTNGRMTSVAAFTPDTRYAIGGDYTALYVWDLRDGRLLRTMRAHANGPSSIAVAPDGRHLLTGGTDATARYWDLAAIVAGEVQAARCVRTYKCGGEVTAAWISADGRTARTGAVTGWSRHWRLPELYRAPARLTRPRSAASLAAGSALFEELLTAATRPGADTLEVLRAARAVPGHERDPRGLAAWQQVGPCVRTGLRAAWTSRTLTGHTAGISAVALGRHCAVTGSRDRTVRIWHPGGVHVLEGHEHTVASVALGPDRVLSGAADRTARFWSIATGECQAVLEGFDHGVSAVALSPDGRLALIGTAFRKLVLLDAVTMGVVADLEGHRDRITSVAFSPDGRYALSASYDGTMRLWSMPSGELVQAYQGHKGAVTSAAFGTDFLVSCGHDRTVRRWAPVSGECSLLFDAPPSGANAVRVTGDGRYLITAGIDPMLRVFSTVDGTLLRTVPGHTEGVQDITLLPGDWQALSGGFDKVARLWYLDWDLAAHRP